MSIADAAQLHTSILSEAKNYTNTEIDKISISGGSGSNATWGTIS
jgi:hypothetical protein